MRHLYDSILAQHDNEKVLQGIVLQDYNNLTHTSVDKILYDLLADECEDEL